MTEWLGAGLFCLILLGLMYLKEWENARHDRAMDDWIERMCHPQARKR